MSSFPSQLLITIVFLFKHISSQSPTSCSNLSPISTVCEDDGYCLINSNSHCTCGQIPWNQDIAFIFDSSMSSTQWTHTTQFAADLLYYGSPSLTTTRTAILQTANPSISSTITLPFGSEPIANTISSTLPNLEQISQSSFYLQLSLQNALNLFNTSSTSNTRKILIIFATKEFSQAPCKINMRANEIYTYTIAIGDFNKYPLTCIGCSENNYSGLISIDNISELSNILTSMEAITCPHKPLIKMTEIQLSGINGQQYIEIYNYGHDIDMSQFQLFDINTPNLPSLQLNQGQLSVIYNTDNQYVTQESIPNCINCQCIESSLTINTNIKWCENTIYIGCCDDNIQNACANNYGFEINLANCKFDNQLSMTAFTIGLIWTNPNTLSQQFIGTLTFDNINLQWPIVATNYALELKNIGYNNQFGSSWTMSCNSNGTPGDNYLLNICPFDCTIDGTNLCNLNGGMNTNQCIGTSCDCLDGFYAYYSTCLPLPLPINCIAIEQGPTASITTYNIAKWDDDTTYLFFHCDISSLGCNSIDQYSETVTSLLTYTVFDQGRDISPTMITLQTVGTNNNIYISQKTICNHITQSPTFNPTLSPTYFIPIVPLCTITLYSDLKRFVLRWNEINFQSIDSPPINTFIGYKYYYNDKFIFIVSCCQITISNTVSFIINSDWVSVSGHWNGITDNEELLSATKCNIITQDPTPLPSKSPTNNPTFKPSINPTNKPTMTPTLGELYVGTCSGTVIRGVSIVNMTWTEANFNINTAPKTDTIYVVEWVYNTRNTPNGYEEISATQNTQKLVTINNYLNVISLQMYCKWSSNTEQGRITICSMFTMLPTISPTIKPSKSPTYPPLNIPTPSPILIPTITPTLSPTYIFDNNITWCNAIYPQQPFNKIILTWDLLYVNENDPNIPPANWIQYIGLIAGDTSGDITNTIFAEHIDQDIECDKDNNNNNKINCWGFAQKSLKSNANISPVLFYAKYRNNGNTVWITPIINCTIDTPEPTLSPTETPTLYPTMLPTAGPVSIYLDNTGCPDDRCACQTETNINTECCINSCDWNKYPSPIIIVSEENKLNTTFYVKRNIQHYPYKILVEFNISAVTETLADKYGFYTRLQQIQSGDFSASYKNITNFTQGGNVTKNEININYTIPSDCYFTNWYDKQCEYYINDDIVMRYECAKGKPSHHEKNTCTWCDFYSVPGPRCNDIKPNDGKFIIPYTDLIEGTFEQSTFELQILTEGCDWGCDWKGEVFLLELTNCNVIMNKTYNNNTDLNCSLIYPSRAYIIVTDQDKIARQELIKVPDEKYDDWLWYVLLGGVVVLSAAAYVLFTLWRNKKITEAHFAQTENSMDDVINEEETFLYPNNTM